MGIGSKRRLGLPQWGPARLCLVLAAAALLMMLGCSERKRGWGAPGTATSSKPPEDAGFDAGTSPTVDPKTCLEAAEQRSYVGCDFWPTVTPNVVWPIFDYAVVVANTSQDVVDVTVERGGMQVSTTQVQPDDLEVIYLPWVSELKGPAADECGGAASLLESVQLASGAYHLVASRPVIVYQFSALEYKGEGGPAGKDWSSCPGLQICDIYDSAVGCFSFSNDASLLLPSTAMTGNYRVTGGGAFDPPFHNSFMVLTGISDDTKVDVKLSSAAQVLEGEGLLAGTPGDTLSLSLDSGSVIALLAPPAANLGGSLVSADKPIQLLSGMPCANIPGDVSACDHIEESVLPAETLGQHYFVARPTGPGGDPVSHQVRLFGNVDGTVLSYPNGKPDGALSTLMAGQVVDLGTVDIDFEIVSTQALAVSTFLLGAQSVDPGQGTRGDPSQSQATSVEQYRTKYVFLAPHDYDQNYVDIVKPSGAVIVVDGKELKQAASEIGSSGYSVVRHSLSSSGSGAHVLTANGPVGIQVVGYGDYTTYRYPGGLNLDTIAPPPIK